MSPTLSGSTTSDPFSILEQDHQEVDELFDQYTQAEEDIEDADDLSETKTGLVAEICAKLTLHARIEEEIVYPELRAVIDQPELIDESEIEHSTAKDLIAQLESMEEDDLERDLTVETLAQCIRAHVAKEENEIFPMAREAGIDVDRIAEAMEALRMELLEESSATGSGARGRA
jgi:hemerythrin-like domain-containing protein